MDIDFPAAHSMDTHWFAVDREGHVALFFTGENGYIPSLAASFDPFGTHKLVDVARALSKEEPPGLDDDGDIEDFEALLDTFIDLGFYSYNYIDSFDIPEEVVVAYAQDGVPDNPLHIDQLPPDLRDQCKKTRFDTVSFDEAEALQPIEYVDCFLYHEVEIAYLNADESILRAVPGHEKKFRKFCKKKAKWIEERADRMKVEEPPPPAEK
jgi:hypothetical protein